MKKDIDNFTEKPLSKFTSNDTFYMKKMNNGFLIAFLLKFKKYSKNIVTGEILDIQPNNITSIWLGKNYFNIGSEISGQITKCYTFKLSSGGCKWFSKKGEDWSC